MDDIFKAFSVFMSKGGIGKTTSTVMLAYQMSRRGKTLIIDADQQGNSTSLYVEDFSERNLPDFLSVLKEEKTLEESILLCREENEECKGLYILGTKKNDNSLRTYIEGEFRNNPMIISGILNEAKLQGFKYVFVDMPPTYGFYEKIILSNMNEIIPVIEPEDFAVDSLSNFNKEMKKLKIQFGGKFQESKFLLLNKENKEKKIHQFWIDTIKTSPFEVYDLIDSRAISSATAMHLPLQEYDPKNKICKTIEQLAERIS